MSLSPKSLPQELGEESSSFETFSHLFDRTLTQSQNVIDLSGLLNTVTAKDLQDTSSESLSQEQCEQKHLCLVASASQVEQHAILSQFWRPCSGEISIGEHLDCIQFPVSYRDLVYRWIALGRPTLSYLRTPLTLRYSSLRNDYRSNIPSSSTRGIYSNNNFLDLQDICEVQESTVIESIKEYFETGYSYKTDLFINFASHLDIYAAVHTELFCLETSDLIQNTDTQIRLYEETWRNTLQAFELDRSVCSARSSHDCFRYLLWGEVYNWPLDEIESRFEEYKNRSSFIQLILQKRKYEEDISQLNASSLSASMSCPSLGNQGGSSPIPTSPSLPIDISSLGLVDSALNKWPLHEFTSFWYNSSSSNSFGTPSVRSPSTPGASTLRFSDLNGDNLRNEGSSRNDLNDYMSPVQEGRYWKDSMDLLQTFQDSSSSIKSPSCVATFDRRYSRSSSQPVPGSNFESNDKLSSMKEEHFVSIDLNDSIACSPSNAFSLSTPATPLMIDSSDKDHIQTTQSPSSSFNRDNLLHHSDEDIEKFLKQQVSEDGVKPILNALVDRRDSTSSIGSSFNSDTALGKIKQYRLMLKTAALQLDTAARLLNVQASQTYYHHQSRKNVRKIAKIAATVNAAAARSIYSPTNNLRRARFGTEQILWRPSRPRNHTTS